MALKDQSAARSTGKVSWFNDTKGYGFIAPDDGGEQIFVHQSSILCEGFRSLTIGESVEFAVTEGNDRKTKAVEVSALGGASLNKEISSRGNGGGRRGGCFNCGEVGHVASDCDGERGGGGECYTCGESGHFARDCGEKPSGGNGDRVVARTGAGKEGCYTCGDASHFARDCTLKGNGNGNVGGERGGGDRACYTCGGIGHMARECATPKRQSGDRACYDCGVTGHLARDCGRNGGSGARRNSGGGCFKCGKEGHFARECSVA